MIQEKEKTFTEGVDEGVQNQNNRDKNFNPLRQYFNQK